MAGTAVEVEQPELPLGHHVELTELATGQVDTADLASRNLTSRTPAQRNREQRRDVLDAFYGRLGAASPI